jgi:hypothetical protein
LFYTLRFTDNYYGGGQSLGNRYFLQIAPLVVTAAVAIELPRRWLTIGSSVCIVVGLVTLWPHHQEPDRAIRNLDTMSVVQRVLPLETNQTYVNYFRCPLGVCRP